MTPADVLELANEAIFTLLKVGGPVLAVALLSGLVIALFQALTQMQEQTLSFVPKIITTAFALILFLPFMMATMISFGQQIFDRVAGIG